jgi:hypothetical protein
MGGKGMTFYLLDGGRIRWLCPETGVLFVRKEKTPSTNCA